MTMPEYHAVIEGYSERVMDEQQIAAYIGYWSGYFGGFNKKKKSLETIIEKMDRARKGKTGKRVPDVDVDAFLEQERKFKEALEKSGGQPDGI